MKTILVINDQSPAAKHAASFAATIGAKMQAEVLLANSVQTTGNFAAPVTVGRYQMDTDEEFWNSPVSEIQEVDISAMDETQLAQMINQNQIDMVVKGMPEELPSSKSRLNIHHVLNKVRCPLLLVPENWPLKKIDRLVYIEDLRFCRTMVVNYLAGIAKAFGASLSVAHLSANGIPDMAAQYADSVFREEVYDRLSYKEVFFNNIKEKDIKKATDVIINGMHNDILAFVNHRFHFKEIMGRYLTDVLPEHITVPVLIFPY